MTKFPEDFKKRMHPVVPGGTQWQLLNDEGECIISVVGGGMGVHGDGVTSFEMYDFREDGPRGYLDAEEINEHLKANPL